MDETGDLKLLIASRYPLIFAEVSEEDRFLELLSTAAGALGLPVWIWSAARGLARLGGEPQYGTTDPRKALEAVGDLGEPAVLVLADGRPVLDDPTMQRRVKEFAGSNRAGQTLVVTCARADVPPALQGLALVWKLKPPTRDEIAAMVRSTLEDLATRHISVTLGSTGIDGLVDALRGLPLAEARRLVQQAALRDGSVAEDDIVFVRQKKAAMLDDASALDLVTPDVSLDDVGGLEALKAWLVMRGRAFEPAAKSFGLEPPRGVLVTGVPGCGKSLVAKGLAASWRMALVALDTGSLYGPYVGESEARLRDALHTAEAMTPVVLWIDEIEKAFAKSGGADGGVSERIFGTFLRWMQERPGGIFVVATSNDVSALPPELLRKGRFDEIFFVDLPESDERARIFEIELARRKRDPEAFVIETLAEASEGFSGAEIGSAVVAGLYRAYSRGTDVTTADLIAELAATIPLSRTRAEDIARIRAWADGRAVPARARPTATTVAGDPLPSAATAR